MSGDLAAWLLEQIAEDEKATWTLSPYACPPGCCAPAGWVGAQCRYCDITPVYGGTVEAITASAEEHAEAIHQRSRVLAECDAKRRMIDLWRSVSKGEREPLTVRIVGPSMRLVSDKMLRLLALPYADRPGFLEEWRP